MEQQDAELHAQATQEEGDALVAWLRQRTVALNSAVRRLSNEVAELRKRAEATQPDASE